MTKAKQPYIPCPRIQTDYQIATRLGMSENTFRSKRTKLEAKGFPNRIDDLDGTDGDAVERWIDMRSGIGTSVSENAQGLLGTIYDKT